MRPKTAPATIVLLAFVLGLPATASDIRYVVPDNIRNAGREVNVTKQLQAFIDQCSASGGGNVVLPPGDYLIGTLLLKENVFLELSGGATIYGSHDINDYSAIGSSGITALIGSDGCKNVGLLGQGTINGQGDFFWRGKERPYVRPGRLILLYKSEQVRVRDVSIVNSPNWCLDVRECDHVWIDSITIRNERKSPNTDGIDPVSSSNVFISNCDIDTGDDAICPKTRGEKPLENLVVTNCVLRSDDSAIKLGTRSDSRFKNVTFSNIVIRDTQYGIALFAKDGGSFENIRFNGIHVETTLKSASDLKERETYPIFVDIEKRNPDSLLSSVKGLVFNDVSIDTVEGSCLFLGQPDSRLTDVRLTGIDFRLHQRNPMSDNRKPRGTKSLQDVASNDYSSEPASFVFAHVEGLEVQGLRYVDESERSLHERQVMWGYDTQDVLIQNMSTKMATPNKELAMLGFDASSDIEVKTCSPGASDGAFIEVDSLTKHVLIHGNNCSDVARVIHSDSSLDESEVRLHFNVPSQLRFEEE